MKKERQARNGTKPPVSGLFCRITKAQISSIKESMEDMRGMLGCGDDDSTWIRHIRNIERFLKNNGLSAK